MITTFKSHLAIAVQNHILFSEPFSYFYFNPDEYNLPIGSRAKMIREVEGGLWVSNSEEIVFFSGSDPQDLDPIIKYRVPVVQGTEVEVPQKEIIPELSAQPGYMVTTEDAVLLLTSDGQVIPLSKQRVTIPPGATGTAMMRDGRYIVIINTYE